jgi:hypothetical protein
MLVASPLVHRSHPPSGRIRFTKVLLGIRVSWMAMQRLIRRALTCGTPVTSPRPMHGTTMSLKTMVADRLPVTGVVTSMPVDVRQMICHILVARGTATAPVVHGRVDVVTRAGRVSMETGVTMPRALRCANAHVSRRITTMADGTNAALCHQWGVPMCEAGGGRSWLGSGLFRYKGLQTSTEIRTFHGEAIGLLGVRLDGCKFP